MLQLKSLRLKNWFNFKDTTIEFGEGPHCLVGVNGIGKTNIGKALYLVKQMSLNESGFEEVIEKFGGFKAVKNSIEVNEEPVELEFEAENFDHTLFRYKIVKYRLMFHLYKGIVLTEIFSHNTEENKDFKETTYNKSMLSHSNREVKIRLFGDYFRKISILFPVDLSLNGIVRSVQTLSEQRTYLLEDLSNFTSLILEWKKEYKSSYKLLISELRKIKHTYSAFEAMPTNTNVVSMYVAEDGLERDTYIGNLSEGTLKYILLLLIILNPNKPSFIFMDEPDTHLHPDMISNLFRLLNEIGTQSLITTHNPLFVDRFEREQILYLTFSEEEGTKVNKAADVYVGEEDVAEPNLLTPYELFSRGYLG